VGRRGPPPKPSRIRQLEGNPSRRPLNPREPQPTGPARCPNFLTGAARKEFERVIAAMPPGLYTSADQQLLTLHALCWTTYRAALALVTRDGLTVAGADGALVAHPQLAVVGRQAELLIRLSDRLGLSPSARARLAMPETPPASKFDGLIGGRPMLRVVPPELSA
jgi:P27 family predicted phage terminase small subunit